MNKNYRNILIASVTFASGLYFFLEFVLPKEVAGYTFGKYHEQISFGFVVIGLMAVGLGLINILRVHGGAVLRGSKGWINSAALLISMLVMFLVEGGEFVLQERRVASWQRVSHWRLFTQQILKDAENNTSPRSPNERLNFLREDILALRKEVIAGEAFLGTSAEVNKKSELYETYTEVDRILNQLVVDISVLQAAYAAVPSSSPDFSAVRTATETVNAQISQALSSAKRISEKNYSASPMPLWLGILRKGFFYPLASAMFALLAFYIATAAYRSFRIRSLEASIMMLAAVFVILGQIPHGPNHIWSGLPEMRLWLLENVSTPAFRAIYFGATIAGLAMATRMWLSLEKSPLAVDEE